MKVEISESRLRALEAAEAFCQAARIDFVECGGLRFRSYPWFDRWMRLSSQRYGKPKEVRRTLCKSCNTRHVGLCDTQSDQCDNLTIRTALTWLTDQLKKSGCQSPRLYAENLLANTLNVRRLNLYSAYDRKLDESAIRRLRVAISCLTQPSSASGESSASASSQ